MAKTKEPAWIAAATAAAVRLAAEAGAEVDELLVHHTELPEDRRAAHATRLEESAELTEVAADLAGLLWAECTDVPPIATILEEPATQAALEAVAEARRQAATRLAEQRSAEVPEGTLRGALDTTSGAVTAAVTLPPGDLDAETVDRMIVTMPRNDPEAETADAMFVVVPRGAPSPPAGAAGSPLPPRLAPTPTPTPTPTTAPAPAPAPAAATAEAPSLRPATGAVLAAAAAAILLFGRRLRRA